MSSATTGRSGRREIRKQRTRELIIDAAVRLFVELGYDQTSVEQIARAVDLARQTVFNHFPAKQDIVHAWVAQRHSEIENGLAAASGDHAVDRLIHGVRAVAALYDADADTSRPMVRHWVGLGGPLLPGAEATAAVFRDVIQAGQAAEQVGPGIDATLTAHVLLDVYLGRLYHWAAHGGTLWHQLEPAVTVVLHPIRQPR